MAHLTDKNDLGDQLPWMERNFRDSIARIRYILEGALGEMDRAVERVDYDRSGVVGRRYTHTDVAAQVTSIMAQAASNMDLRSLVQTAGDLTDYKARLETLELLEQESPELFAVLQEKKDAELQAKKAKFAADEAKRQEARKKQCAASVHESGRGVSFRQCTKPGKWEVEYYGDRYLACTTHRDDFRPHLPTAKKLNLETRG